MQNEQADAIVKRTEAWIRRQMFKLWLKRAAKKLMGVFK